MSINKVDFPASKYSGCCKIIVGCCSVIDSVQYLKIRRHWYTYDLKTLRIVLLVFSYLCFLF